MKNYFSQLAKQSGLRFTGRSGITPRAETISPAPLHQEKTILVAPDNSAQSSSSAPLQNALPSLPQTFQTPEKPFSPVVEKAAHETRRHEESKPSQTPANKLEADNLSAESPTEFAAEPPTETQFFGSESVESPPTGSSETPVVERIVFKETDAAGEPDFSAAPETASVSEVSEVSETTSAAQSVQKDYFKKTGELLEAGEPNSQEIRQILLREVQEWVADAPAPAEVEIVRVSEPVVEISPPQLEREAIAANEPAANRAAEKEVLEEQNFNLSIGTISITVEEGEKVLPPENAAPKIAVESPKNETARRYSRLSRNYL